MNNSFMEGTDSMVEIDDLNLSNLDKIITEEPVIDEIVSLDFMNLTE